jgi:hypothetical protein
MTPSPPAVTVPAIPAAAAAAPVIPAAAAAPSNDALQRELDALKLQVAEGQRTAEFWYNKANAAPSAPAVPKAADEPEVDVLELATKGGKAFEAYMTSWAKKQGFVKGDEMTEAISTKAAELAAQGKLVAQYPDLKNDKSEFFTATAAEYGRLKKMGVSEVVAMEMAAERTELTFLREGKLKTPAQLKTDAEAAKAQTRRDRAAAQSGDHGSRRPEASEEDGELDDEQKQIAIRMLVDADTTPEQAIEKYKKRAKEGVKMRGGFR